MHLPRKWRGPDDTREQLEKAREVLNENLAEEQRRRKSWNQPEMQWPRVIGMEPLAAPARSDPSLRRTVSGLVDLGLLRRVDAHEAAAGPSGSHSPVQVAWELAEPAGRSQSADNSEPEPEPAAESELPAARVCAAMCAEERAATVQLLCGEHSMCPTCVQLLRHNRCPLCRHTPAVPPSPPGSPGSGDVEIVETVPQPSAEERAATAEQMARDAQDERDEAQAEEERLRNALVDVEEEHRMEVESLEDEIHGLRQTVQRAEERAAEVEEAARQVESMEDEIRGLRQERTQLQRDLEQWQNHAEVAKAAYQDSVARVGRLEVEVQRLAALLRRGIASARQPQRMFLPSPSGAPLLLMPPPAAPEPEPDATPTQEDVAAATQVVAGLVEDLRIGETL